MRGSIILLAALLTAATAYADRHKLVINAETDEGQLLQAIGQEEDAARKLRLMEEFVGKHPKHEGAAWVYSQLQPAYMKGSEFAKAMNAGEKLLALDPEDLEIAYQNLKAAEGLKNSEAVIRWAGVTSEIAVKTANLPKPSVEDEVEEWKQHVDYAKQINTYTEYALFAMALQPGNTHTVQLFEALEKRNRSSEYLPKLYSSYLVALSKANPAGVTPAAERLYAHDQNSEDLLIVLADASLTAKQNDRALEYANKLVEVLGKKPKPEGLSDADWEAKKTAILGRAHWIAGVVYTGQNKFAQADQSLRSSLPFIKGNDHLMASALFHLGLSNYRLGQSSKNKSQINDALRFSQQAAGIKGPFQAQASKNVKVIQSEFGLR
jgi:tetratricopeptide (TPR) repeat protein